MSTTFSISPERRVTVHGTLSRACVTLVAGMGARGLSAGPVVRMSTVQRGIVGGKVRLVIAR